MKSQFMTDPQSVISQFDLTEAERRAVLSTHAKLGADGSGALMKSDMGALSFWA
jgi:hypothetical protein